MAKLLLEAGASVLSKDRWGNTPLDESHISGSKPLITLLENAKSSQLSEIHISSHKIPDNIILLYGISMNQIKDTQGNAHYTLSIHHSRRREERELFCGSHGPWKISSGLQRSISHALYVMS